MGTSSQKSFKESYDLRELLIMVSWYQDFPFSLETENLLTWHWRPDVGLESRSCEARGHQHLLNTGCGEGGLAGIQTEEAYLSGAG